jgi:DNA-binding protein HU-beta/integration host factor subunit alpha
VNNKQFITELAQRLGYNAKDTQQMVYQVIDAMGDTFIEGNTVGVQNFGTFEVKKKMERVMVSPTTGQRMLVPPKLVLGFKISPKWKDQIKSGGGE